MDLQKKTALRGNTYFFKNAGWTSFGLIMFPTVSDRFHFSERLIGPTPLIWKADPVQTDANHDAEVFSCDPCARRLHQILHLDLDIQYSLKIPKCQDLAKFNNAYIYISCIYIYIVKTPAVKPCIVYIIVLLCSVGSKQDQALSGLVCFSCISPHCRLTW